MENFSTLPKSNINSTTPSRQRHAVFTFFLADEIKQDSTNTTTHNKRLIALLKDKKLLTELLSTVCENTDGCAKQYICASAL